MSDDPPWPSSSFFILFGSSKNAFNSPAKYFCASNLEPAVILPSLSSTNFVEESSLPNQPSFVLPSLPVNLSNSPCAASASSLTVLCLFFKSL